jgi:hypothetical protein
MRQKGTLVRNEDNYWEVKFQSENGEQKTLQLHPDDVESLDNASMVFDNLESRIYSQPEVEFMVVENQKMDGICTYAKLTYNND